MPIFLSLLIRPKDFFQNHALQLSEETYYFCAVFYCVATSIEQIEKKILMKQNAAMSIGQNWSGYWGSVAIGALFAIISLAIGAWWYDKRMNIA